MPGNDHRRVPGGRTAKYVGVTALTVTVVCLAGLALARDDGVGVQNLAAAYAPPTLAYSTVVSPTPTVTPSDRAATPSSTPAGATALLRAVFLGDGYTASGGASDAAHGFPALVGKAKIWNVDVVACSGAGYVVSGSCGKDYAALIPQVVADDPSIVIVTGGRNDVPHALSSAKATDAFYAELAARLPHVTIYAVSPVWDSAYAPASLETVQRAVKAAATAHGADYLDVGEPLRDRPQLIRSGVMPDDSGYAAIAAAIEGALPVR